VTAVCAVRPTASVPEVVAPPARRTLADLHQAIRAAEARLDRPGISDDAAALLTTNIALLWASVAKAPVVSPADAFVKLDLVADSFERGERLDGADAAMLRQVATYLRAGPAH